MLHMCHLCSFNINICLTHLKQPNHLRCLMSAMHETAKHLNMPAIQSIQLMTHGHMYNQCIWCKVLFYIRNTMTYCFLVTSLQYIQARCSSQWYFNVILTAIWFIYPQHRLNPFTTCHLLMLTLMINIRFLLHEPEIDISHWTNWMKEST